MNTIKLSKYIDIAFFIVTIYIICFFLLSYYLDSFNIAVGISIILTIAFGAFIIIKTKNKFKVLSSKNITIKLHNKLIQSLCLYSNDMCINFFCNLLKLANVDCQIIENQFLFGNDTAYFFNFSLGDCNVDYTLNCYRKCKDYKNIVIFSNAFSAECLLFTQQFGDKFCLCDSENTVALMEKYNCFPLISNNLQTGKTSFKRLLINCLSKSNCKKFAIYGFVLLLFSRFVFFPIYYILSGSIMLILSISIKFFGSTKPIKHFDFNN